MFKEHEFTFYKRSLRPALAAVSSPAVAAASPRCRQLAPRRYGQLSLPPARQPSLRPTLAAQPSLRPALAAASPRCRQLASRRCGQPSPPPARQSSLLPAPLSHSGGQRFRQSSTTASPRCCQLRATTSRSGGRPWHQTSLPAALHCGQPPATASPSLRPATFGLQQATLIRICSETHRKIEIHSTDLSLPSMNAYFNSSFKPVSRLH